MSAERSAASVRFVGDLPGKPSSATKREPRYDALVERLGEWAEWWGDHPYYVHKCVRTVRRDGVKFEGAVRNGKAYIRAVSDA